MTTMDMRENILTAVHNADNRLLKLINALIESYREDEIVAYTVSGEALTRETYRQRIAEAEAEIEKGHYITQEDLEKKVRSWGR